jgi:hypothetical protein
MTNDDIAHLRLLADWHDRQARYLLLTVPAGQHDQGRFHYMAAARLSRLADEATMSRSGGEAQLTGFRGRAGKNLGSGKPPIRRVEWRRLLADGAVVGRIIRPPPHP